MKKVLVAYFSLSGKTERMAEFVAEGVRFSSHQCEVKKVSDLKTAAEIEGYDGYIIGSPTYFQDIPEPMKRFLFVARQADLAGKLGGAFGSYTHEVGYSQGGNAAIMVFDTLQFVFKMEPFELGAFKLREALVDESEGMRSCQAYGRAFGERLGA
jgi:flavodoxin